MAKKKIIILGAGLTGLSCAWHLKKKGIPSVIFEKENSVGGLCRSKKVGSFIFDCDGHLLHFRDHYALGLVKQLLRDNLARHERSAWINNFGVLSRYPFQANLSDLPRKIAVECLWDFIGVVNSRANSSKKNFLYWIRKTYGKGIAGHFMVPYNKKFWTVPLSRMDCSWADKFIPKVGLSEVVNGFFGTGNNHLGYNAYFWYPRKGGIDRLALGFERQIGDVSKNCCISAIDLKNKEITIGKKQKEQFDILVSTIPLPEIAKIAKPVPVKISSAFNKLRWNSIFNLNLGVEGSRNDDKHWIYFPHKRAVFFRAGFYHNFSDSIAPQGKSSIYAEVAYSKNRPINRETIVKEILSGLQGTGIVSKRDKVLVKDTNDIKYGYPIYDGNYNQATRQVNKFLLSKGVITCGRYGSWQYMSMEDAILDGKRAADNVYQESI